MRPLRAIARPEYLYRPVQLWRRLRRRHVLARGDVRLAWGLPIDIDVPGFVGTDILNLGVYDRIVPETICRLLEPGEWAVDVGAHVGQNASAMALAAGRQGTVLAFEPHPRLSKVLRDNAARWRHYDVAPIHTIQKALSAEAGAARLHEDEDFAANRGSASLEVPSVVVASYPVERTTLDACVPPDVAIGLAKLDVEGHEAAVLRGAERLLRSRRLRDLIFEDLRPDTSRVAVLLESAGYAVFALHTAWHKPVLMPRRDSARGPLRTVNFLATLDPDRARARFRRLGWRCLRLRARRARIASGRSLPGLQ